INARVESTDYDYDQGILENRLTEWEATAEGITQTVSRLRGDFEGLEIGGRNLIAIDDIGTSTPSNISIEDYKITLRRQGSSNPNARISSSLFEGDADYVITFKIKKLSGDVTFLSGHVAGIPVSSSTKIFRDGELISE